MGTSILLVSFMRQDACTHFFVQGGSDQSLGKSAIASSISPLAACGKTPEDPVSSIDVLYQADHVFWLLEAYHTCAIISTIQNYVVVNHCFSLIAPSKSTH